MVKHPSNENSRSAPRILERAANLYRADRLSEAAELYSRIHSDAPEHVAAIYQLGMIDLKLGRLAARLNASKKSSPSILNQSMRITT